MWIGIGLALLLIFAFAIAISLVVERSLPRQAPYFHARIVQYRAGTYKIQTQKYFIGSSNENWFWSDWRDGDTEYATIEEAREAREKIIDTMLPWVPSKLGRKVVR